jgi:hypothetical protein
MWQSMRGIGPDLVGFPASTATLMQGLPNRCRGYRIDAGATESMPGAMRAVALQLVRDDPQDSQEPSAAAVSAHADRRLSFAGIGHADPDLSEATEK